ncbi:MAG TPA: hypothetical protein ENK57_13100 [Polyangiaceae bacterium]|nr:hypothetical protein [Polyangiaceae bacterium]
MRIYQLLGFQLAQGRHVARFRLCEHTESLAGPYLRSAFWARTDDGTSAIAPALAHPKNRRMLLQLGGVPDDSKVEWSVRDIGRAGALNLAALVTRRTGGQVLVLVDAAGSRSSPAQLREQVAQATRNALGAMGSLSLDAPPFSTKLVVIAGWRRDVPVPTEARPLPALQREPSILESVPEPQVWGFVPFTRSTRKEDLFLALGRWEEFDEGPWTTMGDEIVPLPWSEWEPVVVDGYGDGAVVELEQFGSRVRVSLRMKSSAHKAAMKKDRHGSHVAGRIRALRTACYGGHFPVGAARFVGETIAEEGPRMHWDWADGTAPSAEAAREQLIGALVRFDEQALKEKRRAREAAAAARAEKVRAQRQAQVESSDEDAPSTRDTTD